MEQQTNLSQTTNDVPKKGKMSLLIGVSMALINIIINLLLPIGQNIFSLITGFSILIAIIFLFIKDIRYIGKKYLLGFFGTALGIAIVGFVGLLIIGFIKK